MLNSTYKITIWKSLSVPQDSYLIKHFDIRLKLCWILYITSLMFHRCFDYCFYDYLSLITHCMCCLRITDITRTVSVCLRQLTKNPDLNPKYRRSPKFLWIKTIWENNFTQHTLFHAKSVKSSLNNCPYNNYIFVHCVMLYWVMHCIVLKNDVEIKHTYTKLLISLSYYSFEVSACRQERVDDSEMETAEKPHSGIFQNLLGNCGILF